MSNGYFHFFRLGNVGREYVDQSYRLLMGFICLLFNARINFPETPKTKLYAEVLLYHPGRLFLSQSSIQPAFYILNLQFFPPQMLSWRVVSISLPKDENRRERGCNGRSSEQISERTNR
jgi:hypothetical protein